MKPKRSYVSAKENILWGNKGYRSYGYLLSLKGEITQRLGPENSLAAGFQTQRSVCLLKSNTILTLQRGVLKVKNSE